MDEPLAKRGKSVITCHVNFGGSKRIITAESGKLRQSIQQEFHIEHDAFLLQCYDPDFNDFVDVEPPENVQNGSKLEVKLHSNLQYGVGASSLRSQNKRSKASTSSVESIGEAQGSKLSDSSGSSSENLFSDVKHPLLRKLRRGKQPLNAEEIEQLVKKVFHIITEDTFFPSPVEILSYVEKLLQEFPALKQADHGGPQKQWIFRLQNKFFNLQNKFVERAQKPKSDASTQTDNLRVIHDMNPIILSMQQELRKPKPNQGKIKKYMDLTYHHRRAFIITEVPKIEAIQKIYPALFNCAEVRKEFLRITVREHNYMFSRNLEDYASIIYYLTKDCDAWHVIRNSKRTAKVKKLPYNWKNACLLLIPYLFNEDLDFLWFQGEEFDAKQDDPYIKCDATMQDVAEGSGFFQVYAENILLAETDDFVIAMECFVASFFVFLIKYRTDVENTLQLLQSFFFEYDDPEEEELNPRVIKVAERLKNKMQRKQIKS